MFAEDFAALEVSRYELRLCACESVTVPAFLGSTLRGALGHALKQLVCVTDQRDCERCTVADRCIYRYLFETPVPPGIPQLRGQQRAPLPFIIEPPAVNNPTRRVWRVPASRVAAASNSTASLARVHGSAESDATDESLQLSNLDSTEASQQSGEPLERGGSASEGSRCRGERFNNRHSPRQSAVTSVVFPDHPRRFSPGEELSFRITLIGRAIEYLPYNVFAVSEMASHGLGANRGKFELKNVLVESAGGELQPIYSSEDRRIKQPRRISRPLSEMIAERLSELRSAAEAQASSSDLLSLQGAIAEALCELSAAHGGGEKNGSVGSPVLGPGLVTEGHRHAARGSQPLTGSHYSLRLRFLTPARIRIEGDLQTGLSFQLLVRNLLRRVSMLALVHGRAPFDLDYRGLIDRAASVRTRHSHLRWWDLERFSNRQAGKMKLGGLIGEIEYEEEAIAEFLPLLVAGELLRVGTATSFGLGKYEMLVNPPGDPGGEI